MGIWEVSSTKGSLEKARWPEPISYCAQGTVLNTSLSSQTPTGERKTSTCPETRSLQLVEGGGHSGQSSHIYLGLQHLWKGGREVPGFETRTLHKPSKCSTN